MENDSLIHGKDSTPNVVSVEALDGVLHIFQEIDGQVVESLMPNKYWLLSSYKADSSYLKLKGSLHYQYGKQFYTQAAWRKERTAMYHNSYSINNAKEASLINKGITYFKNLKFEDVSILAFDIESVGLAIDSSSKTLVIANTYRKQGVITRKLFSVDEYDSEASMLEAWCEWVRYVNPSIMCGHNIYCYDLPYLAQCARNTGVELRLGRNATPLTFETWESKFRKDSSMFYHYHRAHIYGRELVDTMLLAVRYDIGRKYASYGLKAIIAVEGLEVAGRVFYDAMSIKDNWKDLVERAKIKLYAIFDGDDALSIFDLMAPPIFYLTRSVPKPFELMMQSASGSQINAVMVRAYLQQGHSLPKATEAEPFQGAISWGNPGIYKNLYKLDLASLYPSITVTYKISDPIKDPQCYSLQLLEYFRSERLKNKKLAKDTGIKYYSDLEQSQKVFANSFYGFLGARGLNFNFPAGAAEITKKGREILQQGIMWATGKTYEEWNPEKTDEVVVEA